MQVEFLSKFSKDLDHISQKSVKSNIAKLIRLVESADNLNNIPNLKKLVGHRSAYRVRIGDYRVGFFFESHKVIFARVVHRKDIYKVFP
ncbi:MAG: type II toxin-antitoxin system RelE/ParE family toxin [Bacteroidia bacterium]|nr:type II toxin-antitoxin system RelE/ParE family toxin [Sphingobacteriaceae bacterium]MBP9067938.1 type II toxin-antitoxin system RelE/ParE family toxin [Bacteroidia bacterium]